jgi:hypothetical protein
MNPFRNVIADLNLNAESQGSGYDWLFLLLSALADAEAANPTANTYADPYRETLHRLRNYDGFAAQRVAQMLTTSIVGR